MASPEYTGVWKLLYDWQTLIAGVLMFAAPIGTVTLSIVHRRLNEAKTPEDRQRVIFWINQFIIVALAIVAVGSLFIHYIMLSAVVHFIILMILIVGYLIKVARGNSTPLYLSAMLIMVSIYASLIGFIGSVAFTQFVFEGQQQEIETLVRVQDHADQIQSQIIGVLGKVTSHSAEQSKLMDEMSKLQILQSNFMVLLGKRTSNASHPGR